MESTKELRERLQGGKVNPDGWHRPPGYVFFQRGPSIYITRLLARTRVTPNQVTIASIMAGFAGCVFLVAFGWQYKLIGLGLLYLNIILDKVDGELARLRETYSLRGIFWDEVNHLVIPPLFSIALVVGMTKIYIILPIFLVVAGALGSIALASLRVMHSLAPQIYAKKYLKHPEHFPISSLEVSAANKQSRSVLQSILIFFRPLHFFQDFFIIIATTTTALVIEQLFFADKIFHPILAYLALGFATLWILFAIELAIKKSRSIERDIAAIATQSREQ
ncbi:MAG: CDP-alcohol phosphatidyltransferase family protein [Candidatus Ryanbacteria bacterium]|nr:CDP-alcohol phosphatidyltransferase family protein [Candidatus Ryanbacteria bacterium]